MFSLKIEKMKKEYIEDVYKEMRGRGFTEDEIPRVIAKTGFLEALDLYPEAQLHFAIKDAVNEILEIAAKKIKNHIRGFKSMIEYPGQHCVRMK